MSGLGSLTHFEFSNAILSFSYVRVNIKWTGRKYCPLMNLTFRFGIRTQIPHYIKYIKYWGFYSAYLASICTCSLVQKVTFLHFSYKKNIYIFNVRIVFGLDCFLKTFCKIIKLWCYLSKYFDTYVGNYLLKFDWSQV